MNLDTLKSFFLPFKSTFSLVAFFLIIVNAIIVFNTQYVFTHDTHNYIKGYIHVQPAYTIFIHVTKFFFKDSFKEAVIALQFIFYSFCSLFYINQITRFFRISFVVKLVFLFILFYPVFGPYKMCNKLITESVSYGLVLLIVTYVTEWFFSRKRKPLIITTIFLTILILVRTQFVTVSLALLLFLWFVMGKTIFKKEYILFVILLTLPFTTGLIEKAIYGVVYGKFESRLLGNMSFATLPTFLSNKSDVELMTNEDSKHFFRILYNSLHEKNLLQNQLEPKLSLREQYIFFNKHYPQICNQTIHEEAKLLYCGNEHTFEATHIYANQEIGKVMRPLLKKHWVEWLQFTYMNIVYRYSVFLIGMLLLLGLIIVFNSKKSILNHQELILFFVLLILGNSFLIGITIHSIWRYHMYYESVLFLIIIMLLMKIKPLNKYLINTKL